MSNSHLQESNSKCLCNQLVRFQTHYIAWPVKKVHHNNFAKVPQHLSKTKEIQKKFGIIVTMISIPCHVKSLKESISVKTIWGIFRKKKSETAQLGGLLQKSKFSRWPEIHFYRITGRLYLLFFYQLPVPERDEA